MTRPYRIDSLFQRPDLSEWQEGDGNPVGTSNSVWNDNDDFNELSHEANEALRGKKTNR